MTTARTYAVPCVVLVSTVFFFMAPFLAQAEDEVSSANAQCPRGGVANVEYRYSCLWNDGRIETTMVNGVAKSHICMLGKLCMDYFVIGNCLAAGRCKATRCRAGNEWGECRETELPMTPPGSAPAPPLGAGELNDPAWMPHSDADLIDSAFREVCPECAGRPGVNPPDSPFTDEEFNQMASDYTRRLQEYADKYWGVPDSALPPDLSPADRDLYSALNRELVALQPDLRPISSYNDLAAYPDNLVDRYDSIYGAPQTFKLTPGDPANLPKLTDRITSGARSAVDAAREALRKAMQDLGFAAHNPVPEAALYSSGVEIDVTGSPNSGAPLEGLVDTANVPAVDPALQSDIATRALALNPFGAETADALSRQAVRLATNPGGPFTLSLPEGGCGVQCFVYINLPETNAGPFAFTGADTGSADSSGIQPFIPINPYVALQENWVNLYDANLPSSVAQLLPTSVGADVLAVSPLISTAVRAQDSGTVAPVPPPSSVDVVSLTLPQPAVNLPGRVAPATGFSLNAAPVGFAVLAGGTVRTTVAALSSLPGYLIGTFSILW